MVNLLAEWRKCTVRCRDRLDINAPKQSLLWCYTRAMSFLPFFSPIPTFNAGLESYHYETSLLAAEEHQYLLRAGRRKHHYIVLIPGKQVKLAVSPGEVIESLEGQPAIISVAGLGSSLLGAAAFAKSLERHFAKPVVAVIVHYGLINLQAGLTRAYWGLSGTKAAQGGVAAVAPYLPNAEDCEALRLLLMDENMVCTNLVGHSRGALVIQKVLNEMVQAPPALKGASGVVTLGAVVRLPGWIHARQLVGEYDWQARAFSDLTIAHESVKSSGHHLNPLFPGHLSLELL